MNNHITNRGARYFLNMLAVNYNLDDANLNDNRINNDYLNRLYAILEDDNPQDIRDKIKRRQIYLNIIL